MAVELGTGYVSIVADTGQLTKEVKKALGGVEASGETTGKGLGSKIASGLGTTLKAGVATAGVAAGGVLGVSIAKGLGRLTSLDNAQSMMRGLKMSSDDVARAMDGVSASVKGTAFGLDEASGSAAKLSAVGVAVGENLDRTLKLTADIAAQGQTSMDDVSSIMAKIAGAGKVTGETLAQLDDRATGAGAAIANHLGVSIEEMREKVSNGEVDFQTFQAAMEEHLGGAAQRTGETVQGAFKNMHAAMGRFGEQLVAPAFAAAPPLFGAIGKSFDALSTALKPAATEIGELLAPAVEKVSGLIETRLAPALGEGARKAGEWAVKITEVAVDPATWERIGEVFSSVRSEAENLWPAVESLGGTLFTIGQQISVATWQALGDVINATAPLVRDLLVPALEDVARLAEENPGAVKAMVVAIGGFKVASAVAGPLVGAATAIGNVGKAASTASTLVRAGGLVAGVKELGKYSGDANPVLAKAGKSVEGFGKAAGIAGKILKPIGKGLMTALRFVNPWVAGITLAVGALTWFFSETETGQRVWSQAMGVLRDAWNWFTEVLSTGWEWIKTTVWDPFVGFIAGTLVPMWNEAWGYIQGAWDTFTGAIQWAWDSIIQPVFNFIWQVAQVTLGVIGTVILAPLLIAWNSMSEGIKWAWESLIKPAWDAIATAAQWLWESVLSPAFTWIKDHWQVMATAIKVIWETIIKTAWDAVATAAQWLWNTVLVPAFEGIKTAWKALSDGIKWAWDNVLKPVWDAVATAAQWLWNTVLVPAFDGIKATWESMTSLMKAAWDNVLKPAWDAVATAAQWLWNTILAPAFDGIKKAWSVMSDGIEYVRNTIIQPTFDKVQQGVEAVKSFFGSAVEAIGKVWDSLRGKLAKPINFMINTVYNNGILRAWNVMAGFLPGLSEGSPIDGIPEHAIGGAVKGPGTGTSDDVLMWGSNGEHMLTAAEVHRLGGQSAVYAMRHMLMAGQPFTVDAEGQLTGLPHTNNRAGDLAGAAPGLMLPGYKDGGEIRPMYEIQLEAAHEFAQAQHGKPYQWAGPTGEGSSFDCSGFMAAIAAVIQGTNPWQRYWATMSFPSPGAQGFAPGLDSGFSIGIFNGGPYGGHTAGTLGPAGSYGATNVESGGAPSMVKYGIGAAGADDPQFTMQYHLPIGADGAFISGGEGGGMSASMMVEAIRGAVHKVMDKVTEPIKGLLPSPPPQWSAIPGSVLDRGTDAVIDGAFAAIDGIGNALGTVWRAITNVDDLIREALGGASDVEDAARGGLYDTGGLLPHGGVALNLSGKPEAVLTSSQWDAVATLPDVAAALPSIVPALDNLAHRGPQAWDAATGYLAEISTGQADLHADATAAWEELNVAYKGGDWGYGALSQFVGEDNGRDLANAAAALGEITEDLKNTPLARKITEISDTITKSLSAEEITNRFLGHIEKRAGQASEEFQEARKRIHEVGLQARDEAIKVGQTAVDGQLADAREVLGLPDPESIPAVKAAGEAKDILGDWAKEQAENSPVAQFVEESITPMVEQVSTWGQELFDSAVDTAMQLGKGALDAAIDTTADAAFSVLDGAGAAVSAGASMALETTAQAVSAGSVALGAAAQAAGVPGAVQVGNAAGAIASGGITFMASNTDEMYQMYRRALSSAHAGVKGAR
ncbi:tape measure protein [Corynebacterium sp. zg-331]|uniref:tape measure protein n=1 Tax=unclassified Corynebacterium TaxID=2624378 RepID=UPI001642B41A|nr:MULTISPECIES: tape measure protein [unclassified Corynebacterium]MBC3186285.1 tape measure protein [Corynebacterium sp. zg-331]